jgi:hypothetical protein
MTWLWLKLDSISLATAQLWNFGVQGAVAFIRGFNNDLPMHDASGAKFVHGFKGNLNRFGKEVSGQIKKEPNDAGEPFINLFYNIESEIYFLKRSNFYYYIDFKKYNRRGIANKLFDKSQPSINGWWDVYKTTSSWRKWPFYRQKYEYEYKDIYFGRSLNSPHIHTKTDTDIPSTYIYIEPEYNLDFLLGLLKKTDWWHNLIENYWYTVWVWQNENLQILIWFFYVVGALFGLFLFLYLIYFFIYLMYLLYKGSIFALFKLLRYFLIFVKNVINFMIIFLNLKFSNRYYDKRYYNYSEYLEKIMPLGQLFKKEELTFKKRLVSRVIRADYFYSVFKRVKKPLSKEDELGMIEYLKERRNINKLKGMPENAHLNWFYYDYFAHKNKYNYKWAFRYDYAKPTLCNLSEIVERRMHPIQINWNKDWERSRLNFFDLPSGVIKREKSLIDMNEILGKIGYALDKLHYRYYSLVLISFSFWAFHFYANSFAGLTYLWPLPVSIVMATIVVSRQIRTGIKNRAAFEQKRKQEILQTKYQITEVLWKEERINLFEEKKQVKSKKEDTLESYITREKIKNSLFYTILYYLDILLINKNQINKKDILLAKLKGKFIRLFWWKTKVKEKRDWSWLYFWKKKNIKQICRNSLIYFVWISILYFIWNALYFGWFFAYKTNYYLKFKEKQNIKVLLDTMYPYLRDLLEKFQLLYDYVSIIFQDVKCSTFLISLELKNNIAIIWVNLAGYIDNSFNLLVIIRSWKDVVIHNIRCFYLDSYDAIIKKLWDLKIVMNNYLNFYIDNYIYNYLYKLLSLNPEITNFFVKMRLKIGTWFWAQEYKGHSTIWESVKWNCVPVKGYTYDSRKRAGYQYGVLKKDPGLHRNDLTIEKFKWSFSEAFNGKKVDRVPVDAKGRLKYIWDNFWSAIDSLTQGLSFREISIDWKRRREGRDRIYLHLNKKVEFDEIFEKNITVTSEIGRLYGGESAFAEKLTEFLTMCLVEINIYFIFINDLFWLFPWKAFFIIGLLLVLSFFFIRRSINLWLYNDSDLKMFLNRKRYRHIIKYDIDLKTKGIWSIANIEHLLTKEEKKLLFKYKLYWDRIKRLIIERRK